MYRRPEKAGIGDTDNIQVTIKRKHGRRKNTDLKDM